MRPYQIRLIFLYYTGVARYNLLLAFFAGMVAAMAGSPPLTFSAATFATAGLPGAIWFHGIFHHAEFPFYANHHLSKRLLFIGAAVINTLIAVPALLFLARTGF